MFTGWYMHQTLEQEWQLENAYMECQGNYGAFQQQVNNSLRVHY